jgi:ATP-binding cassette subfamily B (MDR/TAP) protein 1
MGAGEVLEQGSHNDLLAKGGDYSKLVSAQKLREQQQAEAAAGDAEAEAMDAEAIRMAAKNEVPLGRSNTSRSLASDLAQQKTAEREAHKNKADLSLYELFRRMALINRSGWKMYAWGSIAAIICGGVYPVFGIVFCKPQLPLQVVSC